MQIKRYRDWPIRLKVLSILFLCCLLPLPLLSIYNAYSFRSEVEDREVKSMELDENQKLARIDQLLRFALELTRDTANLQEVKEVIDAPKSKDTREHAIKVLQTSVSNLKRIFRGVAVLDKRGKVLIATPHVKGLVGQELDYDFDEVERLENSADEQKHRPLITEIHFLNKKIDLKPEGVSDVVKEEKYDESTYQPSIAFVGMIPEKGEQGKKKALGYVVLWLKAKTIWRHFDPDLDEDTVKSSKKQAPKDIGTVSNRQTEVPNPAFFCLVDEHGVIIGHSDRKMLFHGAYPETAEDHKCIQNRFGPSTDEILNSKAKWPKSKPDFPDAKSLKRIRFKDDSAIFIAKPLDKVPWILFSAKDRAAVDETINNAVWKPVQDYALIMLLVALIGTLLGEMLFTRQILKPIRELSNSMGALRAGDLHARVPFHAADEVGLLGQGFNEMAKQLETTIAAQKASEARIRAIVETAGDGIITVTESGVIESFNGAASRMFGFTAEEVIGQNISLLLGSCDGPQPKENLSEQLAKGAIALGSSQEMEGTRKDCSSLPMEVTFSKVGQLGLFTATLHDLTHRKATEQELRRAKEIAEEHDRTKSLFLASMSHELRTPLTIIIGYTEILQEEAEEKGLGDCLSDLQEMYRQAHHLLTLINDILDMSKIEAGKVQLFHETFDLAKVVEEAATTVKPLVAKNNNTLKVELAEDLGTMHTDVTRVRQCLLNLLSNASKFTHDGTITIEVAREGLPTGDMVRFEVRDTGIGITDEQVLKLFQPFTQADTSTTRKYGGTGLGLAITSRLCQLLGGRIEVHSKVSKGSTFTLLLPADLGVPAKPISTTTIAGPPPPPRSKANTVLVVDDEPAARDLIQRSLAQEGFHVVTCGNGEECLTLAKELQPQAITLDVMMPGMDGWAVLSALKSDPETAAIPVVILSIIDDKNLGHALGAADYLVKPVNRERLLSVLKQTCKFPSTGLALVAEDDPAMRDMLRRCLEKAGWTVYEAANGRQALACVAQQRPALILLDLMMPEMDGFEFLNELRDNPEWHSIPVVVITAKELNEEERLFLNGSLLLSGSVKQILQKGAFSRDQLLREVRSLVTGPAN